MQYEIVGAPFPAVVCTLQRGEQMKTEKGSMVWMDPCMKMETSGGGGLGKMFGRLVSGESMFQNIYTAQSDGRIAFGSSFPGQILPIQIAPDQQFVAQKMAFLASEMGVELAVHFSQKLGRGFFGGYPQYDPDKADAATRMAVLTPTNFARKERVLALSEKLGIRPSQISLLYVLSQKANVSAVIGPRSNKDLDNVLEAIEHRLTQEQIDFLTLKRDTLE
jgi:hypothetical protein